MPIFALVVVVLFAATGLAVDAGMAYLTYNGAERAAAAAALAGVPYMPTGLTTASTTSCAGTAAQAACAATARDGFVNGASLNGHPVAVTVSRYPLGCGAASNPCADNKLQVQVTAYVQPTFLHVLGFTDHPVTAVDTALYLPPISLGQPGAKLGSTINELGTSGSYYFLRSEGYGNPRSEGDAYDPYNKNTTFSCTTGTTSPAGLGDSNDVHALNGAAGTDLTSMPSGYNALPTRGGYNYSLATGTAAGYAQVYNPAFAADGGYNPAGGPYNMHEQDSVSSATDVDRYSAMEYTLFSVGDRFNHSLDTPVSQVVVDPLKVTITAGAVSSFMDVRNGQTLTPGDPNPQVQAVFNYVLANVYHGWVDVGNPPTALGQTSWITAGVTYNIFTVKAALSAPLAAKSLYRLRADMLDYKGLRPGDDSASGASPCSNAHRGYAVQLATASGAQCVDPLCQVSALDEMAVYTPVVAPASGQGFSVPLFKLPADYAGQTVNFYIFDPGDVTGTNTISIINPDDASCGGSGPCTFAAPTATAPIYDLGVSRDTPPTTANLLTNGDNSCSTPAVQNAASNLAAVTTATVTGCGRSGPFFNGRWLLFQLQIPSTYAGGYSASSSNTYWQLHYSLAGGVASDTFTIAVNYANSPVHLL